MMRDGPSGGGHDVSGPGVTYGYSWPKYIYYTQKFYKTVKRMNVFCGVPAWRS